MSITGPPDGAEGAGPQKVGVAVTDIMTGLYATVGILAALAKRDRSGQGQHVDLALLDVTLARLANQATNYLVGGLNPTRLGNAHPNILPYQSFAPAYLGINKNTFNRVLRPTLSEVSLGQQTILFDRLEIDAWAEDYIKRNGRRPLGSILEDDLCQSATKCRGSALKTGSGIYRKTLAVRPVAGSVRAQEYLAALRQSKN